MPKVLCTLPNASRLINGVAFVLHPRGVLSVDDLPDDVAASFGAIPGYEVLTDMEMAAEAEIEAAEPKRRGRPPKAAPPSDPSEVAAA